MRLRLLLILFGALAVVLTYTFPLWQPLLMVERVEDLFPGLSADLQISFQGLPPAQQRIYLDIAAEDPTLAVALVTAALQPLTTVDEAEQAMPDMQAPVIVGSGEFEEINPAQWARGSVTIYQVPDGRKLARFENFEVIGGPDLRIVLSASPQPRTVEEVEMNNLDLELGLLKGNQGSQNYEIPAEVDISQYNSVVIYSRTYGIVFSSARI